MQELLHMEEVKINTQKRGQNSNSTAEKLQILTFENFRSGKIGSNFHYKDHTVCGLN